MGKYIINRNLHIQKKIFLGINKGQKKYKIKKICFCFYFKHCRKEGEKARITKHQLLSDLVAALT